MPGPTTPTPAEMPYTSFSATEDRVRLKLLREALRMANVPDATADLVVQRQRQWLGYIGFVVRKDTTGTTTTFWMRGAVIKGGLLVKKELFDFSFPPNDPKYLAEFERAHNYPHLIVEMEVSYIPDIQAPSTLIPKGLIDWMNVWSEWELDYISLPKPPWNQVKIDPNFNKVKIEK